MNLKQRANAYSEAFPKFPPLRADDRWLDGMWMMGNNYKGSGYHGAYPPGYLKRIMAMFPDAKSVLHLFSGSVMDENATTFDIRGDVGADVCGDAQRLSEYFDPDSFDLILADPPYTEEDANRYGTCMVSRNKVLKQCVPILKPGGNVVWLDQVLPMYSKKELHHWGIIGMVRSTNHRFRVISMFRKV